MNSHGLLDTREQDASRSTRETQDLRALSRHFAGTRGENASRGVYETRRLCASRAAGGTRSQRAISLMQPRGDFMDESKDVLASLDGKPDSAAAARGTSSWQTKL
jgi:hypothetical protein